MKKELVAKLKKELEDAKLAGHISGFFVRKKNKLDQYTLKVYGIKGSTALKSVHDYLTEKLKEINGTTD
jgi:hypothetical protein